MSGGKRDDDGRSEFEAAMGDVERLAGRDRKHAPVPPRVEKPPPREREPVQFEGLRNAERLEGRAPGIDRKLLRRLRAGAFEVELRIDLHGLLAAEARESVREALLEAFAAGRRCALVIHGRGLHSADEPVLKRSLPDWLAEPPLGEHVMAFASATPEHGGLGATYVLLRKP
jgi:DNA-nicking Smr family endonuclease